MKRPFNIFPSIGYRNSQFQIISSVDTLKIDIYKGNKLIKSVEVNSNYPTVLSSIESTGKLFAICNFNNEEFKQEIEVKDLLRLGSSEYKKAFVFDDTNFSFFLMKDRLLLYDEKKQVLLTENHYSPTDVKKIGDSDFLFITKVGSSDSGIVNLGIYNTDNFSIVGELLNDYQEIKILNESNKAWLLNIKTNIIHCFQLVHGTSNYFAELKSYVGFDYFLIDNASENIFLIYRDKIIIADLFNLHKFYEITKLENNAIDKFGNVFTVNGDKLNWENVFTSISKSFSLTFEIKLQNIDFLHLGEKINQDNLPIDFKEMVNDIKDDIILTLPINMTYHFYQLPEKEMMKDLNVTHKIFQNSIGIIITEQKVTRNLSGVKFKKYDSKWKATPYVIEKKENSVTYFATNSINYLLIDKIPTLLINDYHSSMLLVTTDHEKKIFFGGAVFNFAKESDIHLFSIADVSYFLVKKEELYTLYTTSDLTSPLLENIKILNYNFFKEHKIIWYSGNEWNNSQSNHLNAFDLKNCSRILVNKNKMKISTFKDITSCQFFNGYALSIDQVVFSPENITVKDAFVGTIDAHSKKLNKILSFRTNTIYLSIFNSINNKYELTEVPLDENKYKESYLSPNGQFLVLQGQNNEYVYYDIEKNEILNFVSGNFLSFNKDGSMVVENPNRSVKIIDPQTFKEITPPNYKHYRFLSPDGKLYAKLSTKTRSINIIKNEELTEDKVIKCRYELDMPSNIIQKEMLDISKNRVEKNRKQFYEEYTLEFNKIGIHDSSNINSNTIIRVDRFIEIGIVGTEVIAKIAIPEDLSFYNYAAFSYDNKFFGYVGKPTFNGLIHLFKIAFEEVNSKLIIIDSYLSRLPTRASWVCGFSKTGYFATYDSIPDTYILQVDDETFKNKTSEFDLRQNIYTSKVNLYHTYKKWNVIKGKNFLCFSPTGKFLALSEQGYDPLTINGYGHQESNAVHIAQTKSGKIINSFIGHGEQIKDNKTKKVAFVAFSDDESRIMTLSTDGVVFIRDLKIKN